MTNKIKEIIKKNLLGFIVGVLAVSTTTVTAATLIASNNVAYDNSDSGLESTNVKGALDELYKMAIPTPTAAETLISKVGQSGLTKITHEADDTLQIGATEDIDEYRYVGGDDLVTNNYVTFNDETWRIIGVFPTDDGTGNIENRIKLIKSTSIGAMYWNSNGKNDWTNATLNSYLNGTFYDSLNSSSKDLIENAKYYLGGYDVAAVTKDEIYTYERKTSGSSYYYSGNSTNWTGKIGLMYESDYGYGASSACIKDLNLYNNSSCYPNDWLYLGSEEWVLTHRTSYSNVAFTILSSGNSTFNGTNYVNTYQYGVRPVLYLISAAEITGGDGTSGNPYTFGLNS